MSSTASTASTSSMASTASVLSMAWPAFAIFAATLSVGCGSSGSDVLYIETPSHVIKVGERVPLRAQATETLAGPPEWHVQELGGGSLMRTQGLHVTYLAPPYAGAYHIIARAPRANGTIARAVQTMVVQPDVSIEPSSTRVALGGQFAFTVMVKGIEMPKIVWEVEEPGGGTITSSGVYTAPTKPGYFHITATAQTEGNPGATATARVE